MSLISFQNCFRIACKYKQKTIIHNIIARESDKIITSTFSCLVNPAHLNTKTWGCAIGTTPRVSIIKDADVRIIL